METDSAVVLEYREHAAPPRANHQIIVAVRIIIEPRNSGAGLTESAREERLARQVIEHFLVMSVIEKVAHIPENRRRLSCFRGGGRVPGRGFVDFVNDVRLSGEQTLFPGPPGDLY